MADFERRATLDWDGPVAPPRRNGELIFDTLWESRVFGITMALCDAQHIAWDEFRERLIGQIAAWERAHGVRDEGFHYYDCWLLALEDLLAAKGICLPSVLEARVQTLAARPPGHDHG